MTETLEAPVHQNKQYSGVQVGHPDQTHVVVRFIEHKVGASYVWKFDRCQGGEREELLVDQEHRDMVESDAGRTIPRTTAKIEAKKSAPATFDQQVRGIERRMGQKASGRFAGPIDYSKTTKDDIKKVLGIRYHVHAETLDKAKTKQELEAILNQLVRFEGKPPIMTPEELEIDAAAQHGITLEELYAQDEANAALGQQGAINIIAARAVRLAATNGD